MAKQLTVKTILSKSKLYGRLTDRSNSADAIFGHPGRLNSFVL